MTKLSFTFFLITPVLFSLSGCLSPTRKEPPEIRQAIRSAAKKVSPEIRQVIRSAAKIAAIQAGAPPAIVNSQHVDDILDDIGAAFFDRFSSPSNAVPRLIPIALSHFTNTASSSVPSSAPSSVSHPVTSPTVMIPAPSYLTLSDASGRVFLKVLFFAPQ